MRLYNLLVLAWPTFSSASVLVEDPSDVIDPADWAEDNALFADYNVPFIGTQPSPIEAAYTYVSQSSFVDHATFSVNANDTSVILVTENAHFDGSYINVVKSGYSSNLLQASFWGFNAALNVANGSTANLDHVNITVHNGAANVYSYGTGTVVDIDNAWLYSSGPVSHGLYASGNGTINAKNIQVFSGGMRSSAFSGDAPAGTVHVIDGVAHTQGIGSATFYALGTVSGQNVRSVSENGPVIFMDGQQNATMINCESTAGLLGGFVLFSSQVRRSGGKVELINSKISATKDTLPAIWVGNTIVNVTIRSSELVFPSNVLVVANYSQITQDFDYYAGYEANSGMLPAEAYVVVQESTLRGDLVPYNGSYISFTLASHSAWNGAAYSGYGASFVDVTLSTNSNWTLTNNSAIQKLVDADETLSNINSGGYTLYYNGTINSWLKGQTISLTGGGSAAPM